VGRDNNTFAKRQREMLKKRKAEDKRARRQNQKLHGGPGSDTPAEFEGQAESAAEPLPEPGPAPAE
jgi:hypothetical protein